ncbi:MAG TPA: bacteriophage holin [Pseudolabrys sp.]|nr:bacteriophage holin [Pseudolabrys sp.]
MNKLQPVPLGLAFGILWAASAFILGLTAIGNWGSGIVAGLATLYIGYGPSFTGAIIGAVWAFFDGLAGGFILAWLYNWLAK